MRIIFRQWPIPAHEQHEDMIAWRGPFNPEAFSIEKVNKQIEKKFRPARKRAVPGACDLKPTLSPQAKQVLEAILSKSAFPEQKRIRIQPNEKVLLELNESERELILEYTFAGEELTSVNRRRASK